WQAMGDDAVEIDDFAQIGGVLYGVGNFRHADATVTNTVARWTGTDWHVLGSGAGSNSRFFWVEGYHGDLYAGGAVSRAFGHSTAGLIRLPAANTVSVDDGPAVTALSFAASPNPGRLITTFSFALPQAGRARLVVFDATGREVARLLDGEAL